MRKFLIALIVTVLILSLYTVVGHAAEPKMEVTVEDVTAVSEQLQQLDSETDMLARLIYSEARGVDSIMEQSAVVWCVLNRVDAGYDDGTIAGVITQRSQFAYSRHIKVTYEFKALARDVVTRWLLEKRGVDNIGRVLPSDYLWFAGRNGRNRFRNAYRRGGYWDWSLPNPYES